MGNGQGLAVQRNEFALASLGEVGDGRFGRGFRLAGLDARDDVGGLLAGVVDGDVGAPWVPRLTRFERPKVRVWTTKTFSPEGSTRTPKPGRSTADPCCNSHPLSFRFGFAWQSS